MTNCRACKRGEVKFTVHFGRQPVCNKFLKSIDEKEVLFDIEQGVCDRCGVVQLTKGPSPSDIRSRFNWATQNEPEGHLNHLVSELCGLPGITFSSLIGGVTFKDDSTLARFKQLGYSRVLRFDPKEDMAIDDPLSGLETIQERFDEKVAQTIKNKNGSFDVIIVRHIFEHAHNLGRFAAALRALLSEQGYLVFEIPDAEKGLSLNDYSGVWEEHIFYFTNITFRQTLRELGFRINNFYSFPYAHENSIVAVVQKSEKGDDGEEANIQSEVERFKNYAKSLPSQKSHIQAYLSQLKQKKEKIAALGAGHLMCSFINLLEVNTLIDVVVDDNPHKQGLYMPGSKIPIVSSRVLESEGIKICLMGINPENEAKVFEKNRAFTAAGGKFFSLFPESRYALSPLVPS